MRWSAADLKRGKLGRKNRIPKEGTNVRRIYDILVSEKMIKIEKQSESNVIENLRWAYGLDIRSMKRNKVYICFGTESQDFTLEAQRILDAEKFQ